MSIEEDLIRAERAHQIMNDPLVMEAFSLMEADNYAAWKGSKASDGAMREEIYGMQRTLEKFQRHFLTYMADGKIAAHNLELMKKDQANG